VSGRIEGAFLRACELDVAVRKPGNVSDASAGHGMTAAMFRSSALAAAPALCRPGARLGERVEGAVRASWAAVDCNTNLGILLLCAPLVMAAERLPAPPGTSALRAAVREVLEELDAADAAAVYRAIAAANPGGLGSAPAQDVHQPPTIGLVAAMALAAERDLIARQYRDNFADLWETGLPAVPAGLAPEHPAAVQAVFLAWLSAFPDSHIVRKRGAAVAQTVMQAAQGWRLRHDTGVHAAWAAWDQSLKAARINPGTSADFTVATLMAAMLLAPATAGGMVRDC
jgi:triphosphoribosyl-dephospho-CoA synthase